MEARQPARQDGLNLDNDFGNEEEGGVSRVTDEGMGGRRGLPGSGPG